MQPKLIIKLELRIKWIVFGYLKQPQYTTYLLIQLSLQKIIPYQYTINRTKDIKLMFKLNSCMYALIKNQRLNRFADKQEYQRSL